MLTIPEGYALVPKSWADALLAQFGWESITDPNIKQVSSYVGVTIRQIKHDLTKIDCPLRVSYEGGNGRGDLMRFFKASVEQYKNWRKK